MHNSASGFVWRVVVYYTTVGWVVRPMLEMRWEYTNAIVRARAFVLRMQQTYADMTWMKWVEERFQDLMDLVSTRCGFPGTKAVD